jgi:hypothetical protein
MGITSTWTSQPTVQRCGLEGASRSPSSLHRPRRSVVLPTPESPTTSTRTAGVSIVRAKSGVKWAGTSDSTYGPPQTHDKPLQEDSLASICLSCMILHLKKKRGRAATTFSWRERAKQQLSAGASVAEVPFTNGHGRWEPTVATRRTHASSTPTFLADKTLATQAYGCVLAQGRVHRKHGDDHFRSPPPARHCRWKSPRLAWCVLRSGRCSWLETTREASALT